MVSETKDDKDVEEMSNVTTNIKQHIKASSNKHNPMKTNKEKK